MDKYKSVRKISDPTRNKMSQKEYVKARIKEKKTKEVDGVKSKVQGAYVYFKERNFENLDKLYIECVPQKYLYIHHGLVAIQDKSTKEIVLVVRCLPFSNMTVTEYNEYEKVTTTLVTMAEGANVIKTNAAQRTGHMYAVGWRGGSDPNRTLGRYVPGKKIQSDPSKLENLKHQQELFPEISTIFGNKFCNLAPTLFNQTRMEVLETQVPTLDETKFDILHAKGVAFGSNLTYTMQDFSNCFHRDRDSNSYSFGMWAPTCSQTGKLTSKENGFASVGGQFLLGSYKVCIDFNACDGIVEIIWRGRTDYHSTIPCISSPNHTRVGTSVQVNDSLVQWVKILREMHEKGDDISKRVRGVNEIVEFKLKNLK